MKSLNIEVLQPRYDSRESFYGKAFILRNKHEIVLYSYNTAVARYKRYNVCYGGACEWRFELSSNVCEEHLFSQTTLRHLKEFYKQIIRDDIKLTKKFFLSKKRRDF